MALFLIDENLPYYFSIWKGERFVHVFDLKHLKTDQEIWEYAETNNLIIVTKDSDFSNRIIYKTSPPKVIHLRVGNMKIQKFHEILTRLWPDIENEIINHKLVNVYADRIESIG
jgi:predicted nuclease of predicted toxin-antitoxin system